MTLPNSTAAREIAKFLERLTLLIRHPKPPRRFPVATPLRLATRSGKREPDTILKTNGRESPELYSRAEFLTRFVRSRPLCNTGIDDPQSHPGSAHIAREVRAAVCPAARTWI